MEIVHVPLGSPCKPNKLISMGESALTVEMGSGGGERVEPSGKMRVMVTSPVPPMLMGKAPLYVAPGP